MKIQILSNPYFRGVFCCLPIFYFLVGRVCLRVSTNPCSGRRSQKKASTLGEVHRSTPCSEQEAGRLQCRSVPTFRSDIDHTAPGSLGFGSCWVSLLANSIVHSGFPCSFTAWWLCCFLPTSFFQKIMFPELKCKLIIDPLVDRNVDHHNWPPEYVALPGFHDFHVGNTWYTVADH